MFCNKNLQSKINKTQKGALWIVNNEPALNLDELVELYYNPFKI